MADDKDKDKEKDDVVEIDPVLEDIVDVVLANANKDKDKDPEPIKEPNIGGAYSRGVEGDKYKEEKKDKEKKDIPLKWVVYKLINEMTGEYYIGVDKYDPKKKVTNKAGRRLLRGKAKKVSKYTPLVAFTTEKEAIDKANEMITDSVINDQLSFNTEKLSIPEKPPSKEIIYNSMRDSRNIAPVEIDGVVYENVREAARKTGKSMGNIIMNLRTKNKKDTTI